MSNIDVNYRDIERSALPRLDYASSYLRSASASLSNTYIPADYGSRGDLKATINDVEKVRKRIDEIDRFIKEQNRRLDFQESENSSLIGQINVITIKKRNKVIKNS